ncbi:elongation factor G [bacterium]|nr:elongation factor G [bacterium]
MGQFTTDQIRNFGLFGHGHSGKTMLAEAMLRALGVTNRLGRIEEGNTVSDHNKLEIERQMSITTSLVRGVYKDCAFNILDAPGFPDFIGEVVSTMRAIDMALLVVDGSQGHDIGHSQAFEMAAEQELPRMFFISKLDRENTKFDAIIGELEDEFGTNVLPVNFPISPGPGFNSIGCALTLKGYKYAEDSTGHVTEFELSADDKAKAEELRAKLMEAAAESDDELLEIFFDKGELNQEQFEKGMAIGIAKSKFFPVLCGAGSTVVGMSRLHDFLKTYGPSPLNRPLLKGRKPNSETEIDIRTDVSEPTVAFVFKTVVEQHVGEMSFVRVFAGSINQGTDLFNASKNNGEKIGQLFHMCGKERESTDKLIAGDIGTMVKLKDTHTGDTLCDKNNQVLLPAIAFPLPVLDTALVPVNKGDEDKIATGLNALHAEDPSFELIQDAELSQLLLKGQGDLHFNNLLTKLKDRYHVEVNMIEPKVPFRETIRGTAEAEGKHKKQSGGRGQFGVVYVKLEKQPRGQGYEFVDAIVGGAIPGRFVPAVDKGIIETMKRGVVAGYPVVDVKVTLFDGKFHDVDSSELAFKIAGRLGFKAAFVKCKPLLLEPIYELTVKVPEEYMGDVMGDLSSRRGKIQGMEGEGRYQVIKAQVPQKELYRYATSLRSMTQGRGTARQVFSHYEDVPAEVQAKIVAEFIEEKEEE